MAQLERNAAMAQTPAPRGPSVDECAVLGTNAPASSSRTEAPVDALDNAARFRQFLGRALGKVLLSQRFPSAKEHDVVWRRLELLFVVRLVVAFADVEDIPVFLGGVRSLALFGTLLGSVGWRRFAGGVLRHEAR